MKLMVQPPPKKLRREKNIADDQFILPIIAKCFKCLEVSLVSNRNYERNLLHIPLLAP